MGYSLDPCGRCGSSNPMLDEDGEPAYCESCGGCGECGCCPCRKRECEDCGLDCLERGPEGAYCTLELGHGGDHKGAAGRKGAPGLRVAMPITWSR